MIACMLWAAVPVWAESASQAPEEMAAPSSSDAESAAASQTDASQTDEQPAAASEADTDAASAAMPGADSVSEQDDYFQVEWVRENGFIEKETTYISYSIPKTWIVERADPDYSIFGTEEYGSNVLRVESYAPQKDYKKASEFLNDCQKEDLEERNFTIERRESDYRFNGFLARRLYASYQYGNGTVVRADILMMADREACTLFVFLYPKTEILNYYRDLESVYASIRSLNEKNASESSTAGSSTMTAPADDSQQTETPSQAAEAGTQEPASPVSEAENTPVSNMEAETTSAPVMETESTPVSNSAAESTAASDAGAENAAPSAPDTGGSSALEGAGGSPAQPAEQSEQSFSVNDEEDYYDPSAIVDTSTILGDGYYDPSALVDTASILAEHESKGAD